MKLFLFVLLILTIQESFSASIDTEKHALELPENSAFVEKPSFRRFLQRLFGQMYQKVFELRRMLVNKRNDQDSVEFGGLRFGSLKDFLKIQISKFQRIAANILDF